MDTKHSKAESSATNLRRNLDRLRHWYGERTGYVNQQSIWLFLATLGCWSVTQPILRLLGLAVTFFIYCYLAVYGLQTGTPARELRSAIESDLVSPDVSAEEKRARNQEYSELETSVMSAANFKRSWLYWFTLAYWFASAVYFAVQFFRPATSAA
jgi:hypothetical protein